MKKASRGTSDVHWWSRELFQLVLSSCERSAFWECVPTTLRIIQEGPARNALQTGERHSGSLQRGGVVATPTCAHGHFTSFLVNSLPKLRQVRRVENVLCIQTFGGGRITIGVTVDFLGQVCPVGGGTYLWDDFGEGCETCLGLFILEDFGINAIGICQKERAHEVFVFKRIGLSGDFEKRDVFFSKIMHGIVNSDAGNDRGGVVIDICEEGEGFKMLMSKDHEVVLDIADIGRWHEASKVFCEGGLKKAVSEIVRRDQVVFDQVEEFAGEEYHVVSNIGGVGCGSDFDIDCVFTGVAYSGLCCVFEHSPKSDDEMLHRDGAVRREVVNNGGHLRDVIITKSDLALTAISGLRVRRAPRWSRGVVESRLVPEDRLRAKLWEKFVRHGQGHGRSCGHKQHRGSTWSYLGGLRQAVGSPDGRAAWLAGGRFKSAGREHVSGLQASGNFQHVQQPLEGGAEKQ